MRWFNIGSLALVLTVAGVAVWLKQPLPFAARWAPALELPPSVEMPRATPIRSTRPVERYA